ncbi:MAG: ABC transporter ATP-binding protein [Dehalococcoidia bacterium]|jgi:iron complex transport system ATP-binding protein|nr:ABC transporter ATP-binding protein [Dehalococcoidia bacterium]
MTLHTPEAGSSESSFVSGNAGDDRALLRVENLSTVLGGNWVVSSVSLRLERGEVLGVVGANGSGKTTLLRTIAGLLNAESGEVFVGEAGTGAGAESGNLASSGVSKRDRARRLAYMPQQAGSHPFTVFEAVLMGRYPYLGRFELEGVGDRELAWAAMERTDTDQFAHRKLDTLSGGERQRVVMARVLVQQADVLLMDEPTSSLDLRHQIRTMELVKEEVGRRSAGAVVILHDLSLAARFCDRLVILLDGRKIADGSPWEVLTPENLRMAFGVEGLVEPDPVTGRPHVLLLGAQSSEHQKLVGTGRTVHLICGAGSGRELMHQLRVAGYTVTAGVLGTGDSDREAAERLGLGYVSAPPFAAITDTQHSDHLELIRAADHVVLCPMAVGANNLRNVEAALGAVAPLVIEPPDNPENGDADADFTDGRAPELRRRLIERAGQVPESAVLFELARLGG